MTHPRQGRLVVLVNVVVGVALIAVIASISLFRQDARPPSLSEFAPPGGQSLGDLRASAAPTTTTTPVRSSAVVLPRPAGPGVPRQLACYAWPDGTETQTFDPQSPACTSRWDVARGNGGATATGVTATTIRVGVRSSSLAVARPYAAWFASHFQLFGRSLQLVPLDRLDLRTPEGQRAAAEQAVEQQLFAVLLPPGPALAPLPTDFLDQTAQHELVSVLARTTQASSTALSALSPYAWSYQPGLDVLQQAAGDLVCELLAGRRATLSPEQSGRQRQFGVLVADAAHAGGDDVDVQVLQDAVDGCHGDIEVERVDPGSASDLGDALRRLKVDGVTTVLPYLPPATMARVVMPAAEQAGYRPEWLLPGTDDDPDEDVWSSAPAKQLRALAGLASWQPAAAATLRPAGQAVAGQPADEALYRALLVLASGIQLAGPRLTADALHGGLSAASFPNPGGGHAPRFQARVGFEDLDHAMVDDVALTRWHDDGFCLVDGGTRWVLGSLPKSDPGLLDDEECS